jgi:hypothetical protein
VCAWCVCVRGVYVCVVCMCGVCDVCMCVHGVYVCAWCVCVCMVCMCVCGVCVCVCMCVCVCVCVCWIVQKSLMFGFEMHCRFFPQHTYYANELICVKCLEQPGSW